MLKTLKHYLPFWIFMILFKFGAGLHYTLMAPLGERIFPIWIIGFLAGGCSLIQLFFDVPAGHLLDRYGYLRMLKITTVTFLFAAVCFLFGLTQLTYFLTLFFSIFGWLFFSSGINAYVLSQAPKEHTGKFMSMRDVSGSIGIVLASASLPFILLLSVQWMGIVLSLLLFVAWILLWFSPKETQSVHTEQTGETRHLSIKRHVFANSMRAMKKLNPASTMLLLTGVASALFYAAIWFVIPLVIVAQQRAGLLGIGLGIFDFAVVVLGFFLGTLADKMNKRTLVFFGLLLFAVTGVLVGFHFDVLFLLFGFLATTGEEMAMLSLWSWLHMLDREHANDGAIAGVVSLFDDLGWALGPMFAGVLYGFIGPSWTIAIAAIPIFVAWIIYQFMMRNHPVHTVSLKDIPRKPHRPRHKT
ncbi:MAG: MFS transporter [Candidatus Uhrbacteria bacterium]|nr:MFS transporter [Candidatus Uhrbacteria bacterium]